MPCFNVKSFKALGKAISGVGGSGIDGLGEVSKCSSVKLSVSMDL